MFLTLVNRLDFLLKRLQDEEEKDWTISLLLRSWGIRESERFGMETFQSFPVSSSASFSAGATIQLQMQRLREALIPANRIMTDGRAA